MATPKKQYPQSKRKYFDNDNHRNFKDPLYKEWRRKIRERDGAKCQMPNCMSKKQIQVHHILKWSSYPTLRFDVNNGICLCSTCHKRIQGQEEVWAPLFMSIIMATINKELQKAIDKKNEDELRQKEDKKEEMRIKKLLKTAPKDLSPEKKKERRRILEKKYRNNAKDKNNE